MKRSIATPHGQATQNVEFTQNEVTQRNNEVADYEAKSKDNAPYERLAELDAIITRNTAEIAELKGRTLTDKEQAAEDEKATIRASLKK